MSNLLQIENYNYFCLAVSVDLELDYSCCLYTETDVLHKYLFYMASPASRQHEPNELGITIYVLKNGKSLIDQDCSEDYMILTSFSFCEFMSLDSVWALELAKKKKQGQYTT